MEQTHTKSEVDSGDNVDDQDGEMKQAQAQEQGQGQGEQGQGQGQGYNFQKGTVNYKPFNLKSYEKIRDFYGFSDALPQESFFVREDHMAAKGRQPAHRCLNPFHRQLSNNINPLTNFAHDI